MFFTAAQMGKFTVSNLNTFNPSKHISTQWDHQGLEVTNFHLPCTNATLQGGEDVNWAKQEGPADPQEAMNTHLHVASKTAGITPSKGHGIRIGSTLKYLLRNIPFNIVKVMGRWVSDTFLVYLRRHTQILAPYMQANPSVHHSFICYTLPPTHG
ncbi:hypothetical protein BS17DRAFT_794022 [Gyrodon lividus]|nr:hypothetical protein BS17DRAFT_794022 [Gyrodon lividus]